MLGIVVTCYLQLANWKLFSLGGYLSCYLQGKGLKRKRT
jgi:hypothetical protein